MLAEYLGLSSMTADDWACLARMRGLPEDLTKVDLFTKPAPVAALPAPIVAPAEEQPEPDIFDRFAALT